MSIAMRMSGRQDPSVDDLAYGEMLSTFPILARLVSISL